MSIQSIEKPKELTSRASRMKWARQRIRPRLSQKELANSVEVSVKAIQLMESENGTQRSKYLDRVAAALKVSLPWLMDGIGEPYQESVADKSWSLPTIGDSGEVDTSEHGYVAHAWVQGQHDNLAQFRLMDDSMAPLMPVGTIVVVDADMQPGPGAFVLAREQEGEKPQLRKWRDRDVSVELMPLNEDFASTVALKSRLKILGCMVGHWVPVSS